VEIRLRKSVDQKHLFLRTEVAVAIAILQPRNFVLLADVELPAEGGDRRRFVKPAHHALRDDRPASADQAAHAKHLAFVERLLVLPIRREDRQVKIVAQEAHRGDLQGDLIHRIDVLDFHQRMHAFLGRERQNCGQQKDGEKKTKGGLEHGCDPERL